MRFYQIFLILNGSFFGRVTRRSFIRTTVLGVGSTVGFPYIVPSSGVGYEIKTLKLEMNIPAKQ